MKKHTIWFGITMIISDILFFVCAYLGLNRFEHIFASISMQEGANGIAMGLVYPAIILIPGAVALVICYYISASLFKLFCPKLKHESKNIKAIIVLKNAVMFAVMFFSTVLVIVPEILYKVTTATDTVNLVSQTTLTGVMLKVVAPVIMLCSYAALVVCAVVSNKQSKITPS